MRTPHGALVHALARFGMLAAGVTAVAVSAAWPEPAGSPTGYDQFRSDIEALESLHPRIEGSSNEDAAIRYVRGRLESLGVAFRRVSYADSETTHSFSSGLEASIPGSSAGTLLLVVPMDHAVRAVLRSDGAAGIAAALRVLAGLSADRPAISVRALFLGAEHGEGPEYPIGSNRFLEGYSPEGLTAVIYLDARSIGSRLELHAGTDGTVSPRWLVDAVLESLEEAGVRFRIRGNETQIFRLGVASDPGLVAPFLRAGLPALALEDSAGSSAGAGDLTDAEAREWLASIERFVGALIADLRDADGAEWDRHYLSFQVGGRAFTVGERAYLLVMCCLVASCLAYAVLSGERGRRYGVALLRGLWSVPIHLGLLFVYALLPTLAIDLLVAAMDFPTLWELAPLQFLLLKVLLCVALFSLLTPLLTHRPFPRTDSFYAATAVLLLIGALVAAAAFEISLAYYFAWALAFTLLSIVARDRTAKILLFLVSPVLLTRGVIELFWLREIELVRRLLVDPLWGNLIVVGAVAPFYFMTLRLRLVLPARRLPARRLIIVAAGIACLIAASATAAWVGYLRPYRDGDARPIAARATFDYDQGTSELTLECPMSIREYTLTSGGTARRTKTRARRASVPLVPPLPPLAVTSSGSAFLDRRNVVVELSPAPGTSLRPYRVTLRLVSGAEFVLFDSSFPFVRDPSGREYAIRIGSSPPFPLRVELTLPRGLDVDLRVSAEYLEFPSDLGVLSPGAVVEPRMEIRFVHSIRT